MSLIQNVKRYLGLEPVEEKLQRFEEIRKSLEESDLQLDELAKDFFIEKSMYEARMKEPENYPLQSKIQEKFDIFIKGHKESIRKAKKQYDSLKKEKIDIEKAFSNHKYIRKEPDGKGGWNYVYEEGEGIEVKADKNLKKWFGNSKVVDETGKPLVVFHGTRANFNTFKSSQSKGNQGEEDQIEGMYFTDNKDGANWYALVEDDPRFLKQVYLSIQNPYEVEDYKTLKTFLNIDKLSEAKGKLKKLGYDGIIMKKGFYSNGGPYKLFLTFEANQIKSATNNDGQFDSNSDDITKSILGEFGDQCIATIEEALKNKKETAYEKIKKAYQRGKISLNSFNMIIKGLTKDEKTKYADFLLFNEEGKILLLKRSTWEDDNAGAWVIPGGHVDPGEDFKTAAIRELQEESGYNVEDAENVGSYEDDKCHIEYFQAHINTSEKPLLLQFAEVRDYKWIPINEIYEETMVFNMRDNILKILGIEDQDRNKKIIRKAILAGIIPVEAIQKAIANIGEVRIWSDGEYKKVSRGKWAKIAGEKEKQLAASGATKKIKSEIDLLSANFQNEKVKFERSLKTDYRPGSIQYKVFFERAWYNEFENNPTLQKIKQDQSDLNKEIIEINEQLELDKKQEREKLAGKKEIDFGDLSETLNPLSKLFQDVKKNIREYLPADQVAPKVTFNDYYIDTEANFDLVLEYHSTSETKDGVEVWKDNVREEWEKMKASGKYEYTHSPKSSSQYLIDKSTGDVFRMADHWGRCASCYWSNLWERDYGIGVCNLKDFTRRSTGSWFNPEFREKIVEASKISLDELRSLVNRNDIYFTDKAKERISGFTKRIFNDELKRSAFLNEEQLNKFKEDYIDLFEERYLKKENLKKAILSGEIPIETVIKKAKDIKELSFYQNNQDKYKQKLERLEARRTDKQYTKEEAEYIFPYKGVSGQMCDHCAYFRKEDDCVKVKGEINPKAHCKFQEHLDTDKSLQIDIEKAYLSGLIPDDLIEKAWKKQPIGTVTTRKDGQQYRKVSETGNTDQDWKLVSKDKAESGKSESEGNKGAEDVKGGNEPIDSKELEIHAKNASESTLQAAIKESADEEVRKVAHNELDRREKEEKVQEETEKETKEKPIKKGYEQYL